MKKSVFTVLLVVFGGFNIFAQPKAEKDEYVIYAKVFEPVFEWNFKPESKPHIVISEDTTNFKAFGSWEFYTLENLLKNESHANYLYKLNPQKGMTPQKLEELLKDFNERNQIRAKLEREIKLKHEYTLISQNELDKLLAEGKKKYGELRDKQQYSLFAGAYIWEPFREKYPNSRGCYNLSRVGYSADKNFALVFMHRESGDDADYTYYIFEKVNNGWGNPKMFGWSRFD
jgi:DNA-binding HxlR family transcriptional regulator